MERFWSKVKKTESCWNWIAGRDKDGYGQFAEPRTFKWRAHRYIWTHLNGPIPEGLVVLHSCDNPSCVNPAHLSLGTVKDNVRDALEKRRLKHPMTKLHGETNAACKLTDQQVQEIRTLYASGQSRDKLSEHFRISKSQLGRILRGESRYQNPQPSPPFP